MKIAIIDYGMGNLASVRKACVSFGADAQIVSSPKKLQGADRIILPGVGAFGDAAFQLRKTGLAAVIIEKIAAGIPFLGICLGMQLLFEKSAENREVKGLGILGGEVRRFQDTKTKVPHIGWNTIKKASSIRCQLSGEENLLKNIKNNSYVYFCHSYYVSPDDKSAIAAFTDYGVKFAAVVAKDNVFGIQFHPEKSQKIGLKILENFIKLC